jgi:hypothetical protein
MSAPAIYGSIVAARASGGFPFANYPFDQLANAVANSIDAWVRTLGVQLTGAAVGAVGNGLILPGTTRILVPPTVSVMASGLTAGGLVGPLGVSLGVVMAVGISGAFTQFGGYSGAAAGVGSGQDVSKVTTANAPALQSLLFANLGGSFGSVGPMAGNLALGLSLGISGLVLLGTGTGTVTGASGPAPGAGPSISVIV